MKPRLLTVKETAARIGCSERVILSAIRKKALPASQIGKAYYIGFTGLAEFAGMQIAREVFDDSATAQMKRAALSARIAAMGGGGR